MSNNKYLGIDGVSHLWSAIKSHDEAVLTSATNLVKGLSLDYDSETKKIILNGIANTVGGNIIIPIDMRIEAITISIIKKGMKIKKPISKARRSSLIMNAGIATLRGVSSNFSGFFS